MGYRISPKILGWSSFPINIPKLDKFLRLNVLSKLIQLASPLREINAHFVMRGIQIMLVKRIFSPKKISVKLAVTQRKASVSSKR